MNRDNQLSLFSVAEQSSLRYGCKREDPLAMSQETLQTWKQRIFHYQQQVKVTVGTEQGSLFEMSGERLPEVDRIHPFSLPQQNTEFWRWKADDRGVSALYFVIDYELPILLYVGETVKSNQRWKGDHDCKRYLLNYVAAHRPHNLPVAVNIAFWANAPVATRARQKLESALIGKWRSPFNKENWEFWGTPFIGSK